MTRSRNDDYFMVTYIKDNEQRSRMRRRMMSTTEVADAVKALLDKGVTYISITTPDNKSKEEKGVE